MVIRDIIGDMFKDLFKGSNDASRVNIKTRKMFETRRKDVVG